MKNNITIKTQDWSIMGRAHRSMTSAIKEFTTDSYGSFGKYPYGHRIDISLSDENATHRRFCIADDGCGMVHTQLSTMMSYGNGSLQNLFNGDFNTGKKTGFAFMDPKNSGGFEITSRTEAGIFTIRGPWQQDMCYETLEEWPYPEYSWANTVMSSVIDNSVEYSVEEVKKDLANILFFPINSEVTVTFNGENLDAALPCKRPVERKIRTFVAPNGTSFDIEAWLYWLEKTETNDTEPIWNAKLNQGGIYISKDGMYIAFDALRCIKNKKGTFYETLLDNHESYNNCIAMVNFKTNGSTLKMNLGTNKTDIIWDEDTAYIRNAISDVVNDFFKEKNHETKKEKETEIEIVEYIKSHSSFQNIPGKHRSIPLKQVTIGDKRIDIAILSFPTIEEKTVFEDAMSLLEKSRNSRGWLTLTASVAKYLSAIIELKQEDKKIKTGYSVGQVDEYAFLIKDEFEVDVIPYYIAKSYTKNALKYAKAKYPNVNLLSLNDIFNS